MIHSYVILSSMSLLVFGRTVKVPVAVSDRAVPFRACTMPIWLTSKPARVSSSASGSGARSARASALSALPARRLRLAAPAQYLLVLWIFCWFWRVLPDGSSCITRAE